jgi:hypothetical protein
MATRFAILLASGDAEWVHQGAGSAVAQGTPRPISSTGWSARSVSSRSTCRGCLFRGCLYSGEHRSLLRWPREGLHFLRRCAAIDPLRHQIAVARNLGDGKRQRTQTFSEPQSHCLFEIASAAPAKATTRSKSRFGGRRAPELHGAGAGVRQLQGADAHLLARACAVTPRQSASVWRAN